MMMIMNMVGLEIRLMGIGNENDDDNNDNYKYGRGLFGASPYAFRIH